LAPLAREEVDPVHEAHPVAARAHEQRVRPRAVREEAHAVQQVAVGDARGGDDDLARREILGAEHAPVVIDAALPQLVDLSPRRRPELRLQLTAEAAQRGSREHGLPRAADADGEMVVRPADGGRDRGGHVAVLDELDARACRADLLDQVVMARMIVVTSFTRRPNASAIASMFSPTGRCRSIAPRARGPTAILRMYMSGSSISCPGSPTAIIDIAPFPPRATTPRPSSGSSARSTSMPPAPSVAPGAR